MPTRTSLNIDEAPNEAVNQTYVTAGTQMSLIDEDEARSQYFLKSPSEGSGQDDCSLCLDQATSPKSTIVCPLCSTRHPSIASKKQKAVVMCSLCATRQPSLAQNNKESQADCPWCQMWRAPFFPRDETQCLFCTEPQGPQASAQPKQASDDEPPLLEGKSCEEPGGGGSSKAPVPDPIKRLPPTELRAQSISSKSSKPTKSYVKEKMQTPLPPVPAYLETNDMNGAELAAESYHLTQSNASTLDFPRSRPKFSNTDVFKGLQVATNAACDEDINEWVQKVTGHDIRQFLAGLSALEGLGTNTMAAVARRAAKQKRQEVRAWEKKGAQ
ncbi:hypothetical protein BJ878DRAFT_539234 [Calycina marina]|uniref:Uncharacterized protein n=1 Tax=Calycina marina TaxID=1763456 RepID=A0A9P7Z8S1_9HELO|nr:hypothetical protein BJ878DRAFT_539234 [Calycina marina]